MSLDASSSPSTSSSNGTPATVVLVHGAWHGAWCWAALQAELDRRGVPSHAVDLPGHGVSTLRAGGLADHIAHVDAVLAGLAATARTDGTDAPVEPTGRVVLVGHSYGGAVVSGVTPPADLLRAVVYVAAFAPLAGESVSDLVRSNQSTDSALADSIVMDDHGSSTLDPSGAITALYGESPDPARRAAVARLGPQLMSSFTEPIETSVIGSVPTLYVRCSLDRAVPTVQQDVCAQRCDEVVTLETDHSPFLSAVDELATVIERVARDGIAR